MKDTHKIIGNCGIVNRNEEIRLAMATLRAGKNLLLEGPVGVGKTVIALAISNSLSRKVFRVDGDERYNEQKLTGWFDPPLVLKNGYVQDAFFPGPLTQAMETGGLLFINELNRMPEGVQNVLLPALDEKIITIPRIGRIEAKDSFQVVAAQNPQEFVATSNLSEALRDRFELIRLTYQSFEDEANIVQVNTHIEDRDLIAAAVNITRSTRTHPKIKRGASVRAAMSITQIAVELGGINALNEAADLALPSRIELKEDVVEGAGDVVREILDDLKKKR